MQIIRQIPNIITAGNLFFGCMAIFFALTGHLTWAPWCIFIAAILDFFDGFAARKLGVSGELGKQLDSLADMVTFGVAPGIITFALINFGITYDVKSVLTLDSETLSQAMIHKADIIDLLIKNGISRNSLAMHFGEGMEYGTLQAIEGKRDVWVTFLPFVAFIIPIFSMLRLGKFNLDTRQTDGFLGLATPANTIFFASLPLILQSAFVSDDLPNWQMGIALVLLDFKFLLITSVLMSFLLVTEIPFFSLKIKNFGWKENKIRYVFIGICIVLIALLLVWAIPFIILTYILMSVVSNMMVKKV